MEGEEPDDQVQASEQGFVITVQEALQVENPRTRLGSWYSNKDLRVAIRGLFHAFLTRNEEQFVHLVGTQNPIQFSLQAELSTQFPALVGAICDHYDAVYPLLVSAFQAYIRTSLPRLWQNQQLFHPPTFIHPPTDSTQQQQQKLGVLYEVRAIVQAVAPPKICKDGDLYACKGLTCWFRSTLSVKNKGYSMQCPHCGDELGILAETANKPTDSGIFTEQVLRLQVDTTPQAGGGGGGGKPDLLQLFTTKAIVRHNLVKQLNCGDRISAAVIGRLEQTCLKYGGYLGPEHDTIYHASYLEIVGFQKLDISWSLQSIDYNTMVPDDDSDEEEDTFVRPLPNTPLHKLIADTTHLALSKLPTERLLQTLGDSLFTDIYGLQDVKAALLVALIGGNKSHFTRRSTIHLLLLGDPGVGKSELLRKVSNIHRCELVTGGNCTLPGLVGSVVKDKDEAIQMGSLGKAHNAFVVFDEINKVPDEVIPALLECMESEMITITKVKSAKFSAATTILAAANPINDRYNKTKTLHENTHLSGPLLSRFNLIYCLPDESTEEEDKKFADFFLKRHCAKVNRNNDNNVPTNPLPIPIDPNEPSSSSSVRMAQPEQQQQQSEDAPFKLVPEVAQEYMHHCRNTELHGYAHHDNKKKARVATFVNKLSKLDLKGNPMGARDVNSIFCVAEAIAKLHLHHTLEWSDIIDAFRLVGKCVSSWCNDSQKAQVQKLVEEVTYEQPTHIQVVHMLDFILFQMRAYLQQHCITPAIMNEVTNGQLDLESEQQIREFVKKICSGFSVTYKELAQAVNAKYGGSSFSITEQVLELLHTYPLFKEQFEVTKADAPLECGFQCIQGCDGGWVFEDYQEPHLVTMEVGLTSMYGKTDLGPPPQEKKKKNKKKKTHNQVSSGTIMRWCRWPELAVRMGPEIVLAMVLLPCMTWLSYGLLPFLHV